MFFLSWMCKKQTSVSHGEEFYAFSEVTPFVHTLTCCTQMFLRTALSLRTSHTFMRVTHSHGSRVPKRFFAHVVATTVCTTGNVHKLSGCTQIFLRTALSLRTSHTFMRVTHSHGSRVLKGSLHMCRFSPSRLVLSHVSPIFCCLRTTTLFLSPFPSTRSCRTYLS